MSLSFDSTTLRRKRTATESASSDFSDSDDYKV